VSRINPSKMRAHREAADLRRQAVAVALRKSYRTIEAYETGHVIPPGDVLVALAALYGVAVEDLCTDDAAPVGAR
jgi:transcriptional regulator with XRE-family HTH domain